MGNTNRSAEEAFSVGGGWKGSITAVGIKGMLGEAICEAVKTVGDGDGEIVTDIVGDLLTGGKFTFDWQAVRDTKTKTPNPWNIFCNGGVMGRQASRWDEKLG